VRERQKTSCSTHLVITFEKFMEREVVGSGGGGESANGEVTVLDRSGMWVRVGGGNIEVKK